MIYDVFPFFNELDVLQIRLEELKNFECKHVMIESPYSFTMKEKPYFYSKSLIQSRHILNVKIKQDEMKHMNPKNNNDIHFVEKFQRDYILPYLLDVCNDNDIIIIGDVDEIPSEQSINEFINSPLRNARIQTKLYRYYYNLYFQNWKYPHIFRWRELKNCNSLHDVRIRSQASTIDGGWHFSSVGNFEDIWYKLNSFGHANEKRIKDKLNKEYIKNRIKQKLHPFKNGKNPGQIKSILDMPRFIQDNQNHFNKLLLGT